MSRLETLRQGLIASGSRTAEVVAELRDEDLECPSGHEWTVRDLLVHLASSERGARVMIEGLLRGESVVPSDFDLDRWNRGQVAKLRDLSLAELRQRLADER